MWRVGLRPVTRPRAQPAGDAARSGDHAGNRESPGDLRVADLRVDQRDRRRVLPQPDQAAGQPRRQLHRRPDCRGAPRRRSPIRDSGRRRFQLDPEVFIGGYGQSLTNLLAQRYPTTQVRVDVSVPLGNRTAKANLASAMAQGRKSSCSASSRTDHRGRRDATRCSRSSPRRRASRPLPTGSAGPRIYIKRTAEIPGRHDDGVPAVPAADGDDQRPARAGAGAGRSQHRHQPVQCRHRLTLQNRNINVQP